MSDSSSEKKGNLTKNTEKPKLSKLETTGAPKTIPPEHFPVSNNEATSGQSTQTTTVPSHRRKLSSASGGSANSLLLRAGVPRMEGHLWKWTNYLKGWQRRLFVLENGVLSYFAERSTPLPENVSPDKNEGVDSSNLTICKGRINLQLAVITPHDTDPTRFAIDVDTRIYHLRADSKELRNQWVDALCKSKSYFEQLVNRAAMRLQVKSANNEEKTKKPESAIGKSTLGSKEPPPTTKQSDQAATTRELAVGQLSLQDDFDEATKSRNGLLAELGRVQSRLRSLDSKTISTAESFLKKLEEIFSPDSANSNAIALHTESTSTSSTVTNTLQGLTDTINWAIHVLTTDEGLWLRRLAVEKERRMHVETMLDTQNRTTLEQKEVGSHQNLARTVSVFEHDLDEDDGTEFFDAIGDSVRSSMDLLSPSLATSEPDEDNDAIFSPRTSSGTLQRRTKLPQPKELMQKPSFWSVLKDSIGKDLSKISMPVTFNEPLSFLQRMAEDIEYSELLDKAVTLENEFDRLLHVSALAVSHYSSTVGRTGKPFNPILGETYELFLPEKNLRFVSEQVSHHPPISASHAEGGNNEWVYSAVHLVANKFWGKSIEVFPTGTVHVFLSKYGDHITYEKATTCAHNIVIGNVWIDNYGEMVLTNHRTGSYAVVKLKKTGWLSDMRSYGEVKCVVHDKSGNPQRKMSGSWLSHLEEELPNGEKRLIWRAAKRPPPEDSAGFNFTCFAITLNELTPNIEEKIPPTDSRRRPDQRALEESRFTDAANEKQRLEEKQRTSRKMRESRGEEHVPLWFEWKYDETTEKNDWKFNGKYYIHRKEKKWDMCPDIF
ncbi:oxysterol-binding protein-like protein [Galdieria sulphuraria]|uniref:Oxysterol-binding protein-like protein n=1 Tax=Galdieria sulphuraria TaxID=130081 RepID=M2XL60_GALSU|nr:oxysterol-binding protein-like protein [Galdieria sulphuraria]EME30877.1 oxysterol-binding protein-like protein [Galdieria sulphuraria]|eukprot:XP_005707397.1 oxysterol-binding protein-like protein [Galdieria sulphuraria]